MKKIISLVLVLMIMSAIFAGCGKQEDHFTGEWKFSKINSLELIPELDDYIIEFHMEEHGVNDEKSLEEAALAMFNTDGTFSLCYLNFDGDRAYTYDPIMERESTWAVYKTGDNEGFISVYTELDVAEGNPDPITNPVVVYNADSNTMLLTLHYTAYMVTIELTR